MAEEYLVCVRVCARARVCVCLFVKWSMRVYVSDAAEQTHMMMS